jgi:hypothetical protein
MTAGVFAALALVLITADLFRAGMGENPATTVAQAKQPTTGAIRYLQSRRPARFAGVPNLLGPAPLTPNLSMRYGLLDPRGYDFPVDKRFHNFWATLVAPPYAVYDIDFSPRAMRALDLVGVSDFLGPPDTPGPPVPGLTLAYDGHDARVFSNPGALPRTWIAGAQDVRTSAERALARVGSADFDPRRAVVSEARIPGLPLDRGGPAPPAGSARILRYDPERVTVAVEPSAGGELVLSDLHYPGWEARVDGRRVDVDRVDYLLRGVRVKPGDRVVEFRYRSGVWRAGWVISLLALGLMFMLAGWSLRRRRPTSTARAV